jgi:hypothetical protein
MDSGIVHDNYEDYDGRTTDPDVAGIGVSETVAGTRAVLTTLGRRILCFGCAPDYHVINRGCSSRRDLNGRHGISAKEAQSFVQQRPKS